MHVNDHSRDDMPALLRATTPRPGPAGPDCLDEETLAAVVDGALDPVQRISATEHLSTCSRCRAAVAGVSRMLADDTVAAAAAERRLMPRWRLPVGLAAAAALVLLFAWPRSPGDSDSIHRDPTLTAGSVPTPVAPVGAVADAAVVQWRAVAGADRYRLTVFDASGHVLYETNLRDTAAVLPASVAVDPGQTYYWKVEARTGWDRWAASDLVEFRVAKSPRP